MQFSVSYAAFQWAGELVFTVNTSLKVSQMHGYEVVRELVFTTSELENNWASRLY